MVNIFENRYEGLWKNDEGFIKRREDLMTEEEIQRVDFYLGKYIQQRAGMGEDMDEWETLDTLCGGDREENGMDEVETFVNVMTPNLEGQVASMTNYNISATLKGRGVGDQKFVKTAEPIVDFILKHNKIKDLVKNISRPYIKFGNTFCTVRWDADAYNGMGCPLIEPRMLGEILADTKIKSPTSLQRADYIIEDAGQFSVLWAEREYGEDIARAIQLGNSQQDFHEKYQQDDDTAFTLLRVWTKMNESANLQLVLMSACGILLEESDASEPYYSTVNNDYPIFYAGLYPSEGKFYRFGDGRLLKPIQILINKLYDEILLALKFGSQGRTFIDPNGRVSPADFEECDPSKFIVCSNPQSNVYVARGAGINDGVYNVLAQLFQQIQEVTRFSSLMTGQSGGNRTATEAGILMQQGNTGIDDKKADVSSMLSDAVLYAFALCLDNWSSGVALRVADDKDDFVWIDAEQLKKIPKMIPADRKYIEQWKKGQPSKKRLGDMPNWMNLEVETIGEDGVAVTEPATNQIMLDLTLSIGEGMPSNKISMYNILISLAQLTVLDETTMQPTPLLKKAKVVSMLEDILGIRIDEDEEGNTTANGQKIPPAVPSAQASQGAVPPVNQDMNVPNANARGVV